jgi:NDP-sugar pyrophosphorylase family protein
MSKTLVVMAAGAGSRFGGPKQTTPIGPHGEWLPEYAVFDARRAGFDRVVFIIRPELEPDFRGLIARMGRAIEADLVYQQLDDLPPGHSSRGRAKPWGTGHAVLSARHAVDMPFAIMNADDFYGAEAYRQGAAACDLAQEEGVASVIAMRLDATLSPHGPVKRGWCQTRDGRVVRLEEVMGIERRDGRLEASGRHVAVRFDGSELVSMNFWVFPPSVLALLREKFVEFMGVSGQDPDAEFLLPEVVNELIAEGRLEVRAADAPGPWFGLTYREDGPAVRAGLERLTSAGVYPSALWGTR